MTVAAGERIAVPGTERVYTLLNYLGGTRSDVFTCTSNDGASFVAKIANATSQRAVQECRGWKELHALAPFTSLFVQPHESFEVDIHGQHKLCLISEVANGVPFVQLAQALESPLSGVLAALADVAYLVIGGLVVAQLKLKFKHNDLCSTKNLLFEVTSTQPLRLTPTIIDFDRSSAEARPVLEGVTQNAEDRYSVLKILSALLQIVKAKAAPEERAEMQELGTAMLQELELESLDAVLKHELFTHRTVT
jgi:hypothetical protein